MATIEPYTLKSGATRYRVRYRTPDRRTTSKRGFTTKRDAKAFAATVEVDKMTGQFIPVAAGKMTVADVSKQWLPSLIDVAESWRRRQESIWKIHVEPKWGRWYVSNIGHDDVQQWAAELASPTREPQPLAPKTVRHIVGVLASILDYAVAANRIGTNPARGEIRLPRVTRNEKTMLTAGQLQALTREVPDFYRPIVWLLGSSGMRWGEMAALRPVDLIGGGRIRLSRSYSKSDTRSILKDLKGHEARTIIVPPQVEEMLTAVADEQDRDELLWIGPRNGLPLKPPKSGNWLDAAVKRCHGADQDFPSALSAHELRHTAASLMISSGAHVKTIQRQLGHKSAAMTLDQYGHLFDDDLDVIADAMGSALFAGDCVQNVSTDDLPDSMIE
ncbi:tyrosine-type recombinase/integrase [Corynebacterium sp. NPDC060344]|uniref:tyrosine-type recombinase/integrase n=1 Tax=Corynebacterium sp. NPDC060344 TaxID=3347101 RepID=UPI00365AA0F1